MAMQEVVCPGCGAINQLIADACWRCLEPLADRPAAAADPEPQAHPRTALA
jgi:predicted amidophosphoribosyltransferase